MEFIIAVVMLAWSVAGLGFMAFIIWRETPGGEAYLLKRARAKMDAKMNGNAVGWVPITNEAGESLLQTLNCVGGGGGSGGPNFTYYAPPGQVLATLRMVTIGTGGVGVSRHYEIKSEG